MAIVVPAFFTYSPRMDIRLQEPITGDDGGEIRNMLDNATHCYASSGRRTVLHDAPASSTPLSTLGGYTTTVANASAYEDLMFVWVELSEDTTGIVWTAWTDDAAIEIQAYDEIAKTTSLGTSTDSGTTAGDELSGSLDLSARAGSFVRIDVRYKAGDATPANSALYSLTIFEDDLTAGELPT